MMQGMVIDMNDEQLHTVAQLQAFLDGTIEVDFAVASAERYGFIARTVRRSPPALVGAGVDAVYNPAVALIKT